MRILIFLSWFILVSQSQYLPVSNNDPIISSGCNERSDGNYAVGDCSNEYVQCVAGLEYPANCPANLIFISETGRCDYASSCGVTRGSSANKSLAYESSPADYLTASDHPQSAGYNGGHYDHSLDMNVFDCSNMPDGSYSHGCSPYYTICSFGVSSRVDCPLGLLFDQKLGLCEWPTRCGTIETVTVVQKPIESSSLSQTERVPDFDCSQKSDGDYSIGCVNTFIQCVDGVASLQSCPGNLLFDGSSDQCLEQCNAVLSSTVADVPVSSTVVSSSSGRCVGSEVSAYGDCSSKFKRCRRGIWSGARCPGATVFDSSIGLCVYDLPRCKTDLFNPSRSSISAVDGQISSYTGTPSSDSYGPQSNVPQLSYGAESYGEEVKTPVGAQINVLTTIPENGYLSNPFFALRHENRRHKDHKHRKHGSHYGDSDEDSVNTGKLGYSARSIIIDGRPHYIEDGLNGRADPHVQQNYHSTFPRSFKRMHKTPLSTAWEELSPELQTGDAIITQPTEITRKNIVLAEDVEGSGLADSEYDQEESSRVRRSYDSSPSAQATQSDLCSNKEVGSFVSMGSCRQDFIFCSALIGEVRAACAVGDLFDNLSMLCVLQDDCGSDNSVDTVAASDSASSLPLQYSKDVHADKLIASDPCEGRADGPLALGCSVSYVICENNVGLDMSCPGGLVFDEGRNICDYRENVAICGGSIVGASPFGNPPIAIAAPTSGYPVDQSRPYKPVSTSPASLETSSRLHSPPSVYRPILTTPMPSPYFVSTTVPSSSMVSTANSETVITGSGSTVSSIHSHSGSRLACNGLSVGYHQTGLCSNSFIYCSGGSDKAVFLKCPLGLAYSTEAGKCLYKQKILGCTEYVQPSAALQPPVKMPYVQEIPAMGIDEYSTTVKNQQVQPELIEVAAYPTGMVDESSISPSGSVKYHQVEPSELIEVATYSTGLLDELSSSPSRSVVHYQPFVSTQPSESTTGASYSSALLDESSSTESSMECSSNKPVAFGKCDKRYTVCSNGVDFVMSCAHPLVFDSFRLICDHSEFVSECSETVRSPNFPVTEVATTTEALNRCDPEHYNVTFATGFCSNEYAVCSHGVMSTAKCSLGYLFDGVKKICVSAEECGRHAYSSPVIAITQSSKASDSRCASKDNHSSFSENECSTTFVHCIDGVASVRQCRKYEVFSSRKGRCVDKFLVRECAQKVKYVADNASQDSFCKDRGDGLYKNPADCTSILQCFGGDVFKTLGCASGLVFNEQTRQCDYRQNVPGCEAAKDPKVDSGCRGFDHGAYISDDSDCTIFYRCVWNRLEKMHCPRGTVFNPSLSVCDWVSNVPSCKNNMPSINSY